MMPKQTHCCGTFLTSGGTEHHHDCPVLRGGVLDDETRESLSQLLMTIHEANAVGRHEVKQAWACDECAKNFVTLSKVISEIERPADCSACGRPYAQAGGCYPDPNHPGYSFCSNVNSDGTFR